MDDQNKNLILATVLSLLVIVVWLVVFPAPEPTTAPDETATATDAAPEGDTALTPGTAGAPAATGETPAAGAAEAEAETSDAPRIGIDTPAVAGSISLRGGRIDELSLKNYRQTLEPGADIVHLLNPTGTAKPYYALFGWAPGAGLDPEGVPGANTLWQAEDGATLTPDSPVTLTWENGAGLTFTREISVDDKYMFTVTQSVENTGEGAATLAPYGIIARHGLPADLKNFFILHEGAIRMADGELNEIDYDDFETASAHEQIAVSEEGWTGFTDHYWMTALIPVTDSGFSMSTFQDTRRDIYQTTVKQPALTLAAGESAEVTTQLFAGAKEYETIRAYQEAGVAKFDDSIDWGWFFFLTKPIFALLHWLNSVIGNMGWSIILLTLIIKALLLPLAYKSYVSMAKMKELQPEMEKIKERAGDDRQQLQKEMMALYKKEKVNPASGCLPILLQIPIFFSLYKVIFVTLELRHAPWFGWLRDLSAPDPSSIFNLFGLLPWAAPEPGSILALIFIGILPLLLGISMWLQQKLNPAPTDPTQKMIFAWMPWVFMFMLGSFASGLVIYWIANNTITFAQQYAIMRSQGYKPDVFGNIVSSFKRDRSKPADDAAKPRKGDKS
ncbi:membrane protein insertase YidC [Roseovarius sp. SCSIO 43702]|uniref:membrane protein insertase YidC n=1 Tax=Roseovarius sp. SCSIO 43702 TaxID=2823043 RepID=UPI001C72D4DA|nr:membrane protein insertase YidC [Roseovarius sp. SCSIO 43702]QYX56724.1 membrane protein insertase YidC [Roseovarius sp. SCSIO 43702]